MANFRCLTSECWHQNLRVKVKWRPKILRSKVEVFNLVKSCAQDHFTLRQFNKNFRFWTLFLPFLLHTICIRTQRWPSFIDARLRHFGKTFARPYPRTFRDLFCLFKAYETIRQTIIFYHHKLVVYSQVIQSLYVIADILRSFSSGPSQRAVYHLCTVYQYRVCPTSVRRSQASRKFIVRKSRTLCFFFFFGGGGSSRKPRVPKKIYARLFSEVSKLFFKAEFNGPRLGR